jgi:5-methylcytosine-specific restriction endonuclease McrA
MRRDEFSSATKKIIALRAAGRCENSHCGIETGDGHYDHIIPCGRGGDNSAGNGQYLCPPCHLAKTRRDVFEIARNKRVSIAGKKKRQRRKEFRPRRAKRVVKL